MRIDSETGLVFHRGHLAQSTVPLRIMQLVSWMFGLLYALLGTRFILEYLRANRGSGFVQFIATITNPFYAPFRRIVPDSADPGGHPIVWSIVVALIAFAVLHAAILGLLRVLARPVVVDDDY